MALTHITVRTGIFAGRYFRNEKVKIGDFIRQRLYSLARSGLIGYKAMAFGLIIKVICKNWVNFPSWCSDSFSHFSWHWITNYDVTSKYLKTYMNFRVCPNIDSCSFSHYVIMTYVVMQGVCILSTWNRCKLGVIFRTNFRWSLPVRLPFAKKDAWFVQHYSLATYKLF